MGSVAPNPMVGAVLVHNNQIIGEGHHQKFGEAHAEVNCINAVKPEWQHLVSQATLYVSLEPCAHFGKTPPCADFIIQKKILKVVIGCRDPFAAVNGKGIEKLVAAGVHVSTNVLEKECRELNKRFFTFHEKQRPYIILKWAQTIDGKIAGNNEGSMKISNEHTSRLVHKWRSEEMAILVGTNTALLDNPELTTRLWPGKDPIRLVIDRSLRLPKTLKLFSSAAPTLIFNTQQHTCTDLKGLIKKNTGVQYYKLANHTAFLQQLIKALYQLTIQSMLVEGGAQTLQSFIDEGLWDEASVITNEKLIAGPGIAAPVLNNYLLTHTEPFFSDVIRCYKKIN